MESSVEMESVDLVIVGAGWSGLSALKTYHEVHPTARILLLDSATTVGGVWAAHRLYQGLKTNNMLGTYEYSDFPMDSATFGVKKGEHIPGHVVHKYLNAYVDHFNIRDLIRLETKVEVVEHVDDNDGGWTLTTSTSPFSSSDEVQRKIIRTKKLLLATGMTSEPFLPHLPGQETYPHIITHTGTLLPHQATLFQKDKKVTIYGGTKSAWDAVHAAATSGANVTWIIRSTGHGPVWMTPMYVTPLKKWFEKLLTTRLLTWFSPCIWGDADGCSRIRKFLHGTWLGRKIVNAYWAVLENDLLTLNNYDGHEETKKLKPWYSCFWVASGLSILNYEDDFYALVREKKVRLVIDDIVELTEDGGIHLGKSGEVIQSEGLICATGWKAQPNMEFRPAGIESELGFPWAEDYLSTPMVKRADQEILTRFPKLRESLSVGVNGKEDYQHLAPGAPATAKHPFRLVRFMVPAAFMKERSVAVLGTTMTVNTPLIAQVQALWVAAFMGDGIGVKARETCPVEVKKGLMEDEVDGDVVWEMALHTQFGKYRCPGGFGKRNPDFVFDTLPYIDMLLQDMGLDWRRKGSLKWLEPYGMEDYRGLVEEWLK
ncbi:hypothetical protein AtubIFM55763_005003 [Aspergillus tubingensis]|uniref:FAD/NAD(P)-binding domain-containing protein n=1 Tax=Aspergillus tubingensis TaxID=5068 RepID=A0A9W6APJ1_ASPTU|nr:hypothetical protein AtubIFM54640_004025 [Aspergillus tubingensis]GLA74062.1 hypothetical protein AtubIFM55763_005003 [Aspergillus tubingensis]GLA84894.1 hypothetical protein AtubIFM56815_009115 [Aspergillus tubingensis]